MDELAKLITTFHDTLNYDTVTLSKHPQSPESIFINKSNKNYEIILSIKGYLKIFKYCHDIFNNYLNNHQYSDQLYNVTIALMMITPNNTSNLNLHWEIFQKRFELINDKDMFLIKEINILRIYLTSDFSKLNKSSIIYKYLKKLIFLLISYDDNENLIFEIFEKILVRSSTKHYRNYYSNNFYSDLLIILINNKDEYFKILNFLKSKNDYSNYLMLINLLNLPKFQQHFINLTENSSIIKELNDLFSLNLKIEDYIKDLNIDYQELIRKELSTHWDFLSNSKIYNQGPWDHLIKLLNLSNDKILEAKILQKIKENTRNSDLVFNNGKFEKYTNKNISNLHDLEEIGLQRNQIRLIEYYEHFTNKLTKTV